MSCKAYDQYSGPRSAECKAQHIICVNYLPGDSTIPFCDEPSALVISRVYPSSSTIVRRSSLDPNYLPRSVRTVQCWEFALNFRSTLRAILMEGDFDFDRIIQVYLVALSITIKCEL